MITIRTTAGTALTALAISTGALALGTPAAQAAPVADQTGPAATLATTAATPQSTSVDRKRTALAARLTYGTRSREVRHLQAKLTAAGYRVPRTGYFGHLTQAAVADLQRDHGLAATGVVTAKTLALLGIGDAPRAHVGVTSSVSASTVASVPSSVKTSATSSRAQAAVDFAYAANGTPYVYGATGNGGYDCSGLSQAAWAAAGVSIPRTSYGQWAGLQSVSLSALQPGDIVVFYGGGHVGIYVGNGMVIHAPHTGQTVRLAPLSSMPAAGAVRP